MIQIEAYRDQYFEEIINLLVSSFESKFCHRQSLSVNDIKDLLSILWDLSAKDESLLHFVAKEEDKIVGDILIQCDKPHKNKGQHRIPLFYLFRKYGILNMLLFIYKLGILEIFKHDDCYIEHIAVDESMRGRGIGDMLLTHAEAALKERGCSSLSLAVAKENPARHLYIRKNFKEVQYQNNRFKGYFLGINEWILMKKSLI